MTDLTEFGWTEQLEQERRACSDSQLTPARIVAEHRDLFRAHTAAGEVGARIAGRLRHQARGRAELPVVGDWVLLDAADADGIAIIRALLPRRSRLSRKAAGERAEEQVLAANVDTLWIATGLDLPLSFRRIERYLALGWESGALPVVLLTKADLAPADAALRKAEVESVAIGAPVHVISSVSGEGLDELQAYLAPGQTVALLGPSGVGKSTLSNRLAGEELLRVGEVLADHRSRHTTTHRQLIRLPSGGMIVDTPGIRELQLWDSDEGIPDTFGDIEELAAGCRFNDCRHEGEPGCAVAAAIEAGQLPAPRLENYHKLQREQAYLDRRKGPRADEENARLMKTAMKTLRFHPKYRRDQES